MSLSWPETNKRDLVGKLAGLEPDKALELARSISDPWYRCQSLAHVAWHLKDQLQSRKLNQEALTAAFELDQPNSIVSVASWVVRVMVKNADQQLALVVDQLLDAIQHESNPVRQADALLFLFEAVYHEPQLRYRVLDPLLRACEQMKSWKRPRILSDIALVLAIDDPDRASQIIDTIGEGRMSRRTRRDIDAGRWLGPHEFFPYYAKPA